jgi:two-component sensor histidine kinase
LLAFSEMGLFELLRTTNLPDMPSPEVSDMTLLRFKRGNISDGDSARTVRESLEKLTGHSIRAASEMYSAVTEAMTNAVHHAYPSQTPHMPWVARTWWLSGSFDRSLRRIHVLFYDQGVGIPATLPQSDLWEKARGWLARRFLDHVADDAHLIRAAMTVRRSRHITSHRGRGLEDIRRFVKAMPQGQLRMISGRGEVIWKSKRRANISETQDSTWRDSHRLGGRNRQRCRPIGNHV